MPSLLQHSELLWRGCHPFTEPTGLCSPFSVSGFSESSCSPRLQESDQRKPPESSEIMGLKSRTRIKNSSKMHNASYKLKLSVQTRMFDIPGGDWHCSGSCSRSWSRSCSIEAARNRSISYFRFHSAASS
jgi:hypothetical protein